MDFDISFPTEPILLIEFLNQQEFYNYTFNDKKYCIVGKDDVGNLIGIDKNNIVFYLDTELNFAFYTAPNINIFVTELEIYNKYVSENELSDNPSDNELKQYTYKFTEKIKETDCNALTDENSFWSVIAEQMETEQL